MGDYLKLFETTSEYETYIEGEDILLPNVSYCEDNNCIYYNPYVEPKETRLVITYNVESTVSTHLYSIENTLGQIDFSAIEIDGLEVSVQQLDSQGGYYQFETTGEHTVKYTLANGSISDYRFYDQEHPIFCTSVFIPSGLINLGNHVEIVFDDVDTIVIDEDNPKYTSNGTIGNCIIDKTNDSLIYACKNTIIPDGVVSIADEVGVYSGIESLVIPNSVTTIGVDCFNSCWELTSLTIGSGVTTIGSGAFSDCENLSTVTIYGTNDLSEILPYSMWVYATTLYVDSSMIATYQDYLSGDFSTEVLPIQTI